LGEPIDDLERFEIGGPDQKIQVRSQLPKFEKERLIAFIHHNKYVFAWSHEDMPVIDPPVIVQCGPKL